MVTGSKRPEGLTRERKSEHRFLRPTSGLEPGNYISAVKNFWPTDIRNSACRRRNSDFSEPVRDVKYSDRLQRQVDEKVTTHHGDDFPGKRMELRRTKNGERHSGRFDYFFVRELVFVIRERNLVNADDRKVNEVMDSGLARCLQKQTSAVDVALAVRGKVNYGMRTLHRGVDPNTPVEVTDNAVITRLSTENTDVVAVGPQSSDQGYPWPRCAASHSDD